MSTRTTYTSTITVPVYASWKCEKCGETNFSSGVIVCKRSETTRSLRKSKLEEAKEKASMQAHEEWAQAAYSIINNPNQNGSALYNNFHLENTNCTKCGKKPEWYKTQKLLPFVGLLLLTAIISGIVAFSSPSSIVAWLIFAASAGLIAWGIIREELYKKYMVKLSKEYTPVIGSLNEELITYAHEHNGTIPTPDDAIQIAKNNGMNASINNACISIGTSDVINDSSTVVINKEESACFCRKCGAKLPVDSDFCNKCGTKVIK